MPFPHFGESQSVRLTKIFFFNLVLLCSSLTFHQGFGQVSGYTFRKSIDINDAQVSGTSDLIDFPVLLSFTDTDLQDNLLSAQGFDITFTDSDGVTPLDHELQSYNSGTGELVVWVRIPTLRHNVDTRIYMYYANASETADPSSVDTWQDFIGVWHLEESGTGALDDYKESSATGNDARGGGGNVLKIPVQSTGIIGNGQDFDAVDDYIKMDPPVLGSNLTVSAWINHDAIDGNIQRYINLGNTVVLRYDGANAVEQLHFQLELTDRNEEIRENNRITTTATWYHVAGTYDGTTMELFLNGASIGTLTAIGTLETIAGNSGIALESESMNGLIDEVHVSNVTRSADWITTEYNNQSNPAGFITLGAQQVTGSPGGVSADLAIWLKADAGTSVITDATSVSAWNDQSINDNNVTQGTGTAQPIFRNNATDNINFHPVMDFDGTQQYMEDVTGILGSGSYDDFNVYIVSATDVVQDGFVLYEFIGSLAQFSAIIPNGAGDLLWTAGNILDLNLEEPWGGSTTTPYLWSLLSSNTSSQTIAGTTQSISRDGQVIDSDNNNITTVVGADEPFYLGTSSATVDFFSGRLAEVAVYTGPITTVGE